MFWNPWARKLQAKGKSERSVITDCFCKALNKAEKPGQRNCVGETRGDWSIGGSGCGSNLQAGLQYSNILPVLEKMTTPTRASHSTASSLAFLSSPPRRLEKVTWRFVEFSIRLISIFPRPMAPGGPLRSIQKAARRSLVRASCQGVQDANSLLPAWGSSKQRG